MSEERQLTREEWIQRMQDEGLDEVILQEMIRLGFWEETSLSDEKKQQSELEKKELVQLRAELRKLKQESAELEDMQHLLQEARKKRIEESRRKREERKVERARQRRLAEERWAQHKATHVVHAGVGFSYDLQDLEPDEEKLTANQLPCIQSAVELAKAMDLSLRKMEWLTYHRGTATVSHYMQYTIPKKSGGFREIASPKPDLRKAQFWLKEHVLDPIPIHPRAMGFVQGKNTVDNAKQHVRKTVVIKLDLQDFFPSITFHRVKGLFQSLGYSGMISTLFALLTTEPPRQQIQFDGTVYYVAMDKRQLPQGACTSPGITNLICRRLDGRLHQLASRLGIVYTRYADDLTFSCDIEGAPRIGHLLHEVRQIVNYEGFLINPTKTRILRSSGRQRVTGIVVNEKATVSRKELRTFRALLHNVEKNGLEKENRTNHPDFWGYIQGYASYVSMVRPDLAPTLQQQVERIGEKYGL